MLKIIFIGYILFCVCLSISVCYNFKDALKRNNITKETYPRMFIKQPLPKRIVDSILFGFIMLTPILNLVLHGIINDDKAFMGHINKLYKS